MDGLLRARLAADRLRTWDAERHGAASAPDLDLDLDGLIAALGLSVAAFGSASQPDGTLGYLEPGEDVIFLRAGLSAAARRFTLAHELGHAVLHRAGGAPAIAAGLAASAPEDETPCATGDLALPFDLVTATDEQLAPNEAYSARSAREAEANAFAAALLLPSDALLASYLASASGSTRTLASRFGVSEDVVLRRLTALLVPVPDEAPTATDDGQPAREDELNGSRDSRDSRHSPLLDDCQVEAARARTPALVIAGPGTGKTSTLVERISHLVAERGVSPDAILALTYSNKAARELRARVAARLESLADGMPATASTAEAAATLPTVSTIHAFCGALLRRYAPLVGLRPDFQLVSEAEGYFLLRQVAPRLRLAYFQPVTAPARYYPDVLAAISRAKDELAGPGKYALLARRMAERATTPEEHEAAERAGEIATLYTAYQETLDRRGDPDFGDIVRLAVRLLAEHPDVLAQVRTHYQEVLVDEFQDINRAMGMLLRTLCGPAGPLWAVGDPDQAIYRFRGASPANIAQFAGDYPASHRLALDRNHRSRPAILQAAGGVARTFLGSERPALQATRTPHERPAVTLAVATNDAAEWAGIAAAIAQRQAEGYALSEQAILCRTRRQAQRLAAALEEAGIPTRTLAPLLEQPDVLGLLGVITLLADPSGAGLLRAGDLEAHHFTHEEARAVLTEARARGVAPTMLLAHAEGIAGVSREGARAMARLAGILARLRSAPDVATGLARYVFSLTALGRTLLRGLRSGDPEMSQRAQHVARLLALARSGTEARQAIPESTAEEEQDAEAGRDEERAPATATPPPPPKRAPWGEFLDYARVLLLLRQERGASEDLMATGADGVWVLTVHASKGLEFPVVYLPGLAARRFPIQRQAEPAPLPPGLTAATPAGAEADAHLAEESSLFYVALTRARDHLVLSVAERYGAQRGTASPFLSAVAHALGPDLHRERWGYAATPGMPGTTSAAPPPAQVARTADDIPPSASTNGRETISASEIETYLRCPRQYAYQHVYGLHPRDGGAGTLRRALRATLAELARDAPGTRGIPVTLAEVRALFDQHWAAQVASPSDDEAGSGAASTTPRPERSLDALYRRYGHQALERAWRVMVQQEVAPSFNEDVRVRVGEHDIVLPVDRIERAPTPDAAGGASDEGDAGAATRTGATRLVRQRAGRASERTDVRALLYHLAAEGEASGARTGDAHAYQEFLGSGTVERVTLSTKQVERLSADVERALAGIHAGHFPPHRNAHTCASCPFVLICPA